MEVRLRRLLLTCTAVLLYCNSALVWSQVPDMDELKEIESVIQPVVERVEFNEAKITEDNFEIIPSIGLLSIEDFGANLVLNIKLHYHVSEDFFVGAEYGRSEAGKTSFEVLSGGAPLITEDERILNYYLFTLGYNMLPGEAFATDKLTYNTALYVNMGIGSVDFAGDNNFDFMLGLGYRLLISNFSSVYLDVREHLFSSEVLGEDKLTKNTELTLGFSFYF